MDFHLSLSSIIIIIQLFLISFFLTILPPSFCEEDDPFVVCNRTHACGKLNISFPFSGGNRRACCGQPGHELRCVNNDEYLVMGFEGLDFRVLNINTSYPTFTIARLDLWDGPCAPKYKDTTLNYTLFDYASTVQNLTIFYGCPDVQDYNIPTLRNRFNCSQGVPDEKFNAYYLEDESPSGVELHARLRRDCANNIQVPILRSSASVDLLNDRQAVEKAMDEGFEVEYSSGLATACGGCKQSGGVCGSNYTGEFVCYCRNQVEPYRCPKPGKHALFSSLLSVSWIRLFAGYSSCFLISLSYNPITHRPPLQSGVINIFLIWQPEQLINNQ
jgi:hypothetical protein